MTRVALVSAFFAPGFLAVAFFAVAFFTVALLAVTLVAVTAVVAAFVTGFGPVVFFVVVLRVADLVAFAAVVFVTAARFGAAVVFVSWSVCVSWAVAVSWAVVVWSPVAVAGLARPRPAALRVAFALAVTVSALPVDVGATPRRRPPSALCLSCCVSRYGGLGCGLPRGPGPLGHGLPQMQTAHGGRRALQWLARIRNVGTSDKHATPRYPKWGNCSRARAN